MSKMNELSQMLERLITCGETLVETGQALKAFYTTEETEAEAETETNRDTTPTEAVPATGAKTYSKEDVRGILAAKANEAGGRYKASVKAIVKKYSDGGSLTDVSAESYEALVKEVEGLIDG